MNQETEGEVPLLDYFQTERAIKLVKDIFERRLAEHLSLMRVTAPRFLKVGTGLQDDLAGTQVPVRFTVADSGEDVEMVHSLAKWKRWTLGKFSFKPGQGLYTDMDAVRKDEKLDDTHSLYVDQWDWEKVITPEQRSLSYLEQTVKQIYQAMKETELYVLDQYIRIKPRLPSEIKFCHSEDLERRYPSSSPREREDYITREMGAVFIIGIGYPLKSGESHDKRAADYDDWSTETLPGKHGLNGDIIVWDDLRQKALEISSMGIRVDPPALLRQLKMMGIEERKSLDFHQALLEERIPLSIGGGIGQSRLCFYFLQKTHIGEVQSSYWPDETIKECAKKRITLL